MTPDPFPESPEEGVPQHRPRVSPIIRWKKRRELAAALAALQAWQDGMAEGADHGD